MTTCKASKPERALELQEFILQHREDNVSQLALALSGSTLAPSEQERMFVLQQIEGWQRLRTKVPSWAECEGVHFPVRLSVEQCSSEPTAQYKAQVVARLSAPHALRTTARFIDLTGGMGVDFSYMARDFKAATYIERNAELCRLARHNFPLLGLPSAEIVEGDGVEYIEGIAETIGKAGGTEGAAGLCIYLDPFRRDDSGHKTVRIEDCTPNVVDLLPCFRKIAAALQGNALHVMVKLSPMLDITAALRALPETHEVHIVGSGGEVKEVLLCLRFNEALLQSVRTICHDDQYHFEYLQGEESALAVSTAEIGEGTCIFDPAPIIMKAGCFAPLCTHFGLLQLHPNSHLFVAPEPPTVASAPASTPASAAEAIGFPGRTFRIIASTPLGKRPLREFLAAAAQRQGSKTPRANLATRNFPQSVAELRKRLHLLDGGSEYWFATTLSDGSHALIACEKQPAPCEEEIRNNK